MNGIRGENSNQKKRTTVYDSCPHCGRELSPWEKVLLSVDRMLMCKGCWYRIILPVSHGDDNIKEDKPKKDKP